MKEKLKTYLDKLDKQQKSLFDRARQSGTNREMEKLEAVALAVVKIQADIKEILQSS